MANPRIKMSKGIRKFIRHEKARIRKEVSDVKEQEKQISELYSRFAKVSAGFIATGALAGVAK